MRWGLVKALKNRCSYFMLGSALLLLAVLGLHHFTSSHIYVVSMGERELGSVENPQDVESFVEDLTKRCSDLYGLELELKEEIVLVREVRPDFAPDPETVQGRIRQLASFYTNAYMISVDGEPFVPVTCPDELDRVIDFLKEEYLAYTEDRSANILEVALLEELALIEQSAALDDLYTAEEIVALLTEKEDNPAKSEMEVTVASRSTTDSRYMSERPAYSYHSLQYTESVPVEAHSVSMDSDISLSVRIVEEITEIEKIPFEVEYIEDRDMLKTESEVASPGLEGEKEIVFHVVTENGEEVEQIIVSETVINEPQAQVEKIGLKEPPPPIDTGRLVWPVQGQGIIYNGFSNSHRAIDIHIDHGTNVLAADAGVVTYSGYGGTQGNYLILHHGSFWTLYLHNSEHLVRQGERVSRGQVIAKVGATGRAFGPHLHFEVRVDDGTRKWHSYYQHEAVNPMQFFNR